MDIKQIAAEIGIDAESLLKLFDLYIKQTEVEIKAMRSAVNEKDWDCLKRTAHSIKGASMNLEQEEIAVAAKELERIASEGGGEALLPHIISMEKSFGKLKKEISGL